MKYYLVAGEASGDLHASHLMTALKQADPEAQFRFIGGDMMAAVGGQPVRHYRDLAYMGIIPVVTHLGTILRAMGQVKRDIMQWLPHALILIDYPGFNLSIAHAIHSRTSIPTFYYIAPKIWAWKERRIKNIKRDIDHLLSILPFEVEFFEGKHHYPIDYVGNPTMDEVSAYLDAHPHDKAAFCQAHGLDADKPIIALLAGSRRQEIRDNLAIMLQAVQSYRDTHNIVLAAAPGIDDATYDAVTQNLENSTPEAQKLTILRSATYPLLQHADAALVTSGTATLETALFRVPQVVCYRIPRLYGWLRPLVLKIPYVSLVNLVAGREVVPELLADLTPQNLRLHLASILPGGSARAAQLSGYDEVAQRIGLPGAPRRAAASIMSRLAPNFACRPTSNEGVCQAHKVCGKV